MCGRCHSIGSSGISRSEVPAYLLVPCDPVSGEFLDHVCRAHSCTEEHRCSLLRRRPARLAVNRSPRSSRRCRCLRLWCFPAACKILFLHPATALAVLLSVTFSDMLSPALDSCHSESSKPRLIACWHLKKPSPTILVGNEQIGRSPESCVVVIFSVDVSVGTTVSSGGLPRLLMGVYRRVGPWMPAA